LREERKRTPEDEAKLSMEKKQKFPYGKGKKFKFPKTKLDKVEAIEFTVEVALYVLEDA
jgi:hypothetical protein